MGVGVTHLVVAGVALVVEEMGLLVKIALSVGDVGTGPAIALHLVAVAEFMMNSLLTQSLVAAVAVGIALDEIVIGTLRIGMMQDAMGKGTVMKAGTDMVLVIVMFLTDTHQMVIALLLEIGIADWIDILKMGLVRKEAMTEMQYLEGVPATDMEGVGHLVTKGKAIEIDLPHMTAPGGEEAARHLLMIATEISLSLCVCLSPTFPCSSLKLFGYL